MFTLFFLPVLGWGLALKDNLQRAQVGDYLVVSFNKTDTVMLMQHKEDEKLTIEEISIPEGNKPRALSWKMWVEKRAPGHISWVHYIIDLRSGKMLHYYSFTKRNWFEIPESDHFLSKLLALSFTKAPLQSCKKIGPKPSSGPDLRVFWQPKVFVEGKPVQGIAFEVWKSKWPKDGSPLSGKPIEIYLPKDNQLVPSYFPYWLQVQGAFGKAKLRIIDSGKGLDSPQHLFYQTKI